MAKKTKQTKLDEEAEDILVVKDQIEIEEGKHSGTIVDVTREYRGETQQYDYTDIHIEVDGVHDKHEDLRPLKVGFPTALSKNSGLGILLDKAGFEVKAGNKIKYNDIQEKLLSKKLTFLTNNEETANGTFARIIRKTIKFK